MSSPAPKVLLVANPGVRDQLGRMLADGGFPPTATGDGNDATLADFNRDRPDVVVVCADLDAGDPRALIHAMRERPGPPLRIVLIGEERGPIRTALDASDFQVDRFVRRPLSPKALLYAVRSSMEVTPPPSPGPAVRLLGHATPRPKPTPAVDRAVDTAIDDFVSAAIGALGGITAQSAPLSMINPAEDRWEAPVPPAREPTLILSGGGAVTAEAAVPRPAPPDTTERGPAFPLWEDPPGARAQTADPVPRDPATADLVADLADLDADLASGSDRSAVPEEAIDTPSGAFGRELRHKMSQMAERLFPNRRRESGLLDVGVAHGHQTEIDLATIDGDPSARASEPAAFLDDAVTYAEPAREPSVRPAADESRPAAPEPEPEEEGTTGTTRRISAAMQARGNLADPEEDVAALLGRLFAAGFTGRVLFRDPPAEKVIHFDQGRPVFASSNQPHDRMGDLLFREGKITREQYARSRDVVAESGRRMGEILVEMGFLKRRELLPAVRRHVEDVLYSLFAWASGEYHVHPGEFAASERIRLSRHPAALILEGIRRKLGQDHLERRLGSPTAVVATRDRDRLVPITTAADLGRNERTAIAAFDGERTLADVAGFAEIPLLNAYQLAHGLVVLGAAEVIRRGDDEDEADPVRPPSLVGETDLAIDRQRVLAKHALVAEADYFSLLGVRRDATGFEIRRAYEAARRDYAGDSFPAEVRRDLDAEIGDINDILEEAYRVLQDDGLRARYLANLQD